MSFQFSPETILSDVNQKLKAAEDSLKNTVFLKIPEIIYERKLVSNASTRKSSSCPYSGYNYADVQSDSNREHIEGVRQSNQAIQNNITSLNETIADLQIQAKLLVEEIKVRGGKLITPLNSSPIELKSSATATSLNPLFVIAGIAALLIFTKS